MESLYCTLVTSAMVVIADKKGAAVCVGWGDGGWGEWGEVPAKR